MQRRSTPTCVISSDSQEAQCGWDAGAVWEERLWVGSLQAARDIEALEANGITSVLTMAGRLRVWDDDAEVGVRSSKRPACVQQHLSIDIADHPCADLLEALPAALEFIDRGLAFPTGRVLVHCASGVSRSVSTCIAWLITRQRLSLEQALEQVRVGRPLANPNMGFSLQLQQFERLGGDHAAAQAAYKAQIAATGSTSLGDVIARQREIANEFHARADAIELELKSAVTSSEKTISSRLDDLLELQSDIDAVVADYCDGAVQDRPARMITKSASGKVTRLLEELGASVKYPDRNEHIVAVENV